MEHALFSFASEPMRRSDDSIEPSHIHTPADCPPLTRNESSEGQWCPLDDSDGTSSSSSSETSRTWGEPIHQDINNAEGGTGSTLDPATDGGVCVVANGGGRKAAIDSFVGVPTTELCSSIGGENARSGPTTATRTSTIPHGSGTIDASLGRTSSHVLSNGKYSTTDKCGCGRDPEKNASRLDRAWN